jgi:hypothetical protein
MIFWNFDTPLTLFACCIWNFCEFFEISAGKFGPTLFGLAIGRKGKKLTGGDK